jgi:hypothetical protein
MTATMKGGADLSAFFASLPAKLGPKVLRGALKAGAEVIADGAREKCRSAEVRDTIGTVSKSEPGVVTAKVQTKGPGAFKAPWLENGTDPHFISVDPDVAGGRTAGRVNRLNGKGSSGVAETLIIGGKPVGKTVHHPGSRSFAFMRPALDEGEQDAIAAVGNHIAAKLTKEGLAAPAPPADPDE